MNVIWKFPLRAETTEIEAPIDEFLTVQMQDGLPCVWAIVNPDKSPRKYNIFILGTGWECNSIDASKYIGTVQEGAYVWHCFWDKVQTQKNVSEPIFSLFSSKHMR